jgi:hypothetical protein
VADEDEELVMMSMLAAATADHSRSAAAAAWFVEFSGIFDGGSNRSKQIGGGGGLVLIVWVFWCVVLRRLRIKEDRQRWRIIFLGDLWLWLKGGGGEKPRWSPAAAAVVFFWFAAARSGKRMALIPCQRFGRSDSLLGLQLRVYIEVEKASTGGTYITERSIRGGVLL